MQKEFDFIIDDLDFSSTPIEYYDIEINSPISEEDIRYAQLEDIIFRKSKNEFNVSKINQEHSWQLPLL